jgi:hypothetical protein
MRLTHIASCIVLSSPLFALAAPAHVHGVAKMDLALDGNTLSVSLEMPLDTAVGFEYLPKTEKQKAALAEATDTLKKAAELFVPTAAGGCTVKSVEVGNPFPDGKAKADGHADFDADYVFHCAKPIAVNGLETTLFKRFSRLHRIEVQRATAGGQGAATMTPEQARISW